jgi:stalled ribosome rescue protein Dom34
VASEKKIDERRKHHLRQYYQKIIRAIQDSRKVLIFGPGEAKLELEKEIRKSKELAEKLVGVEAADKMTERQVAAKVRRYFFPGLK